MSLLLQATNTLQTKVWATLLSLFISGIKILVLNDYILKDAFFHKNITISDNKYYVNNAGYHNTNCFL